MANTGMVLTTLHLLIQLILNSALRLVQAFPIFSWRNKHREIQVISSRTQQPGSGQFEPLDLHVVRTGTAHVPPLLGLPKILWCLGQRTRDQQRQRRDRIGVPVGRGQSRSIHSLSAHPLQPKSQLASQNLKYRSVRMEGYKEDFPQEQGVQMQLAFQIREGVTSVRPRGFVAWNISNRDLRALKPAGIIVRIILTTVTTVAAVERPLCAGACALRTMLTESFDQLCLLFYKRAVTTGQLSPPGSSVSRILSTPGSSQNGQSPCQSAGCS